MFVSKQFYQHHQMLEFLRVFLARGRAGTHQFSVMSFFTNKTTNTTAPIPKPTSPIVQSQELLLDIRRQLTKFGPKSRGKKSGLQGTEFWVKRWCWPLQPSIEGLWGWDSMNHPRGLGSNCLWPTEILLQHVGGEVTPYCNSAESSGSNL